jgi:hypothetical protein
VVGGGWEQVGVDGLMDGVDWRVLVLVVVLALRLVLVQVWVWVWGWVLLGWLLSAARASAIRSHTGGFCKHGWGFGVGWLA